MTFKNRVFAFPERIFTALPDFPVMSTVLCITDVYQEMVCFVHIKEVLERESTMDCKWRILVKSFSLKSLMYV
jgi:hypothetical protein